MASQQQILLSKIDETKISISPATNTIKIPNKPVITSKIYTSSIFTSQNTQDNKLSQLYVAKMKAVVNMTPKIFGDNPNATDMSLLISITDEEAAKLKKAFNVIITEAFEKKYYKTCKNKLYSDFKTFKENCVIPLVKENFKKDENGMETDEKYPPSINIKMKFDPSDKTKFKSNIKFMDGKNNNALLPVTVENIGQYITRGTICNLQIRFAKVAYSNQGVSIVLELVGGSFNKPEYDNITNLIPACDDEEASETREEFNKNNPQTTTTTTRPTIVDSGDEQDPEDSDAYEKVEVEEPTTTTKKKSKKGKEPAPQQKKPKKSKKEVESEEDSEEED